MLRPQTPIASGCWWLHLQAASVTRLSCTNLLTTSLYFDMLVKLFNLRFQSFHFTKFWLRAKSNSQLLILHFLSHNKSLFSKISDDVVACDLWFSPIANPKSCLRLCIKPCAIYIPDTRSCILVLFTHIHDQWLTTRVGSRCCLKAKTNR